MQEPEQPATSKSEVVIFLVIAAAIVFGVWKFVSPMFAGGDSPPVPVEAVEEMGSGGACNSRLSALVNENYLLNHGLEIKDGDEATIVVVAQSLPVCQNVPPSLTVDQGAQAVVQRIKDDL